MIANDCPGDMMEIALWHVAENREASNAEYDIMTAAGLLRPGGAGGVDASLWTQEMPPGDVGCGLAPLAIPDIVLKSAWHFVQHALLASLSRGCYGHRIAGTKTKFEPRSEDLNSPTEASAVAAAGVEGILLRRPVKLGSATPGDVERQLSKKQQRDHLPDAGLYPVQCPHRPRSVRRVFTGFN
jgi:hypothetical protein